MTSRPDFLAQVCAVSLMARKMGYNDVAVWMQAIVIERDVVLE